MMSITEAGAVQDVLELMAESIVELRAAGHTDDEVIVATQSGRSITLGRLVEAAQLLADKSYKPLMAGLDGARWAALTVRLVRMRAGAEP